LVDVQTSRISPARLTFPTPNYEWIMRTLLATAAALACVFCAPHASAATYVCTDAQGNINAWNIWARADTVGVGDSRCSLETVNIPGFTADLVGIGVFPGACDSGAPNPRALTTDAGSWLLEVLLVDGFEG
jgi:hypothetical protein